MPISLPDDWEENECCNTWLEECENGAHIAWITMQQEPLLRLEISVIPTNYPGFELKLLSPELSADASLAKHISESLGGWIVHRCNIEGVTIRNYRIVGDDE